MSLTQFIQEAIDKSKAAPRAQYIPRPELPTSTRKKGLVAGVDYDPGAFPSWLDPNQLSRAPSGLYYDDNYGYQLGIQDGSTSGGWSGGESGGYLQPNAYSPPTLQSVSRTAFNQPGYGMQQWLRNEAPKGLRTDMLDVGDPNKIISTSYEGEPDGTSFGDFAKYAGMAFAGMGGLSAAMGGSFFGGAPAFGSGAAAGAGGAGALDLGGGLWMTPDGAIVGGSGAFTAPSAADMAFMTGGNGFGTGVGGAGSMDFGFDFGNPFDLPFSEATHSAGDLINLDGNYFTAGSMLDGSYLNPNFMNGGGSSIFDTLRNGGRVANAINSATGGNQQQLIPGIPNSMLGTVLGGLLGSQGTQASTTQARELPEYLKAPLGDMATGTQAALAAQGPQAQQLGQQLVSQGQGLLSAPVAGNGYGQIPLPQYGAPPPNQAMGNGFNTVGQGMSVAGNGAGQIGLAQGPAMPNTPVAGNGFGQVSLKQGPAMPNTNVMQNGVGQVQMAQAPAAPNSNVAANGFGVVKMDAPNTPTNPYLSGMASDIQRRTQDMLGQNNAAIRGNAVGVGGLGGSRQGVAEGISAAKAADSLSGSLASLYGSAYDADMNRALSKYGTDVGFYNAQRNTDAGLRAQDLDTYNQGLNRDLSKYTADQGFYQGQRGQDINLRAQDLDTYNQAQGRNLQQYGLDQGFFGQQRNSDLAQRAQDIGLYDSQKNRDLTKYAADQSFYQGQRGQDLQRLGLSQDFYGSQRAQDLTQNAQNLDLYNQQANRALNQYQAQTNFFGNQRGQDMAQLGIGSGLLQQGLDTPFAPYKNMSSILAPFSGMGSTTTSQSAGGGLTGALGGALGMAQLGSNMKWW